MSRPWAAACRVPAMHFLVSRKSNLSEANNQCLKIQRDLIDPDFSPNFNKFDRYFKPCEQLDDPNKACKTVDGA
jgi:hypothetical protein